MQDTKPSCRGRSSKTGMHGAGVALYSSLFLSNLTRTLFHFENVTFENNTALVGGAVYILADSDQKASQTYLATFTRCNFLSNTAMAGGAVYIVHADKWTPVRKAVKFIYFQKCNFRRNIVSTDVPVVDVWNKMRFGNGGAINCRGFEVHLIQTLFFDNSADQFGGTIFDRDCLIRINDAKFVQSDVNASIPLQGQIAYTSGIYFLNNVTIEIKFVPAKNVDNSYVWFTGYGTLGRSVAIPRSVSLKCPVGYDIEIRADKLIDSAINGSKLLFRCLPCEQDFYSLSFSFGKIISSTARHIQHVKCRRCPYGGVCYNGIKAKPNFWGYKSGDAGQQKGQFLPCPTGYVL